MINSTVEFERHGDLQFGLYITPFYAQPVVFIHVIPVGMVLLPVTTPNSHCQPTQWSEVKDYHWRDVGDPASASIPGSHILSYGGCIE